MGRLDPNKSFSIPTPAGYYCTRASFLLNIKKNQDILYLESSERNAKKSGALYHEYIDRTFYVERCCSSCFSIKDLAKMNLKFFERKLIIAPPRLRALRPISASFSFHKYIMHLLALSGLFYRPKEMTDFITLSHSNSTSEIFISFYRI